MRNVLCARSPAHVNAGRQRALTFPGRRAIEVLSTPHADSVILDELKVNPILTAYFIYGND